MAGEAYFVGVHCLEEAIRRVAERGDRLLGLMKTHFDVVHKNRLYDLDVIRLPTLPPGVPVSFSN